MHVVRVGAEGDGIGRADCGEQVYVAGALPGETIQARIVGRRGDGSVGRLNAVLQPSPARIPPPCSHFGACGGCVLQHWRDALGWKAGLLRQALERAGFAEPAITVAPAAQPGERRRLDLALRRQGRRVLVGLHRARSGEVVDVRHCLVSHPKLAELLAPLRAMLGGLGGLRRAGTAVVNLLDTGPDLLLRTDAAPDVADRHMLVGFARDHGLARVHWALQDGEPEPVCLLRPATIRFAGTEVEPPPGAFLQATAAGERAIVAAVLKALPAKGRVAELFAGIGTISFPMAEGLKVFAWEGDGPAAAALRRAAAGRIGVTQRDLARQPLQAAELRGFAAVVLDPPFAGAASQVAAIAESDVARVVYVSCNPAALTRDARMLRAAGFELSAATLVDQFLWSARIEAVAAFSRRAVR